MNSARTILHISDLPDKLCVEVVMTATYVMNRIGPSPEPRISPYELWHKKKPEFGHLKVFGTECFVQIQMTQKLSCQEM